MNEYVAFLRAVNVAGHAIVRMNDLRAAFQRAGGRNVRTVIQSGNVLFEASAGEAVRVVRKVRNGLGQMLGVNPEIILRRVDEINAILASAPFGDWQARDGVKLYVTFLARDPKERPALPWVSSREALEVVRINGREAFVVSRRNRRGFFGFPNNFIEEKLGVPATTRNWPTVARIGNQARAEADGGHRGHAGAPAGGASGASVHARKAAATRKGKR